MNLENMQSKLRKSPETVSFLNERYGVDLNLYTRSGLETLQGVLASMGEANIKHHSSEVQDELHKIRVREDAKRAFFAERAEELEDLPDLGLTELLSTDISPEQFVVQDLLLDGGNVMFTAARKSGKSTVVGNLIRSLVDGDAFLDSFDVVKRRTVTLVDLELSPGTLQRWLREQGIRNTDAVRILPLRGKARAFNIMDDATRARIANQIAGTDVLILDPLRPLADALGLNEHTEMGRLLEAFDALKTEAGISEGVIVHHHGHNSDRARGDSRLEDWPDAIWRLNRDNLDDPKALRMFSAFGRDVEVEQGALRLDGRRLTFTGDVPAAKGDMWTERIVAFLAENGESNTATIREGIGMAANLGAPIFKAAVESGVIVVRNEGPAKFYSLPTGDADTPF
ncbi:AAA family ATPase [Microbacterium testaceum]|uniref:AAA family ATPase n=1 Tax=Microbacterium testaceum TaxID=2033 RepID=UPI002AC53963|nr:AAA family ATPase [Microbacterium testaceum]MDZ5145342.1 helicase RepA family protein [Microbacterium testaceum]